MANLYFKEGLDNAWENPLNWWLNSAATTPALNAPWLDGVDAIYLAFDLILAAGETNGPFIDNSSAGINIGTGATGTCDIAGVINAGTINGGTFSGDNFSQYYIINGGTFTGSGFTNADGGLYGIYNGTFTGDGFYNANGQISDGTFTGNGFTNGGFIYNGTFTGNGFTNTSAGYGGFIYDGTFTGSGFINELDISGGTFTGSGFTNGGFIYNGTFTGSGFINENGQLLGGTFSGDSLVIGDDGQGNTTIGLGTQAPTYSFPTPASGSDQTIARLLNLPWFVNL